MKIRVVKLGGSALERLDPMLEYVESLRPDPVVLVHGGGPQMTQMLQKLGHTPTFQDGLRVTDRTTLDVVEMVLAGQVNKRLVMACQKRGLSAVGVCGVDGGTLTAPVMSGGALGFVGETPQLNPHLLLTLLEGGFVPVLSPLCLSPEGEALNVNADTTAAAVAVGLKAQSLIFLTDVAGVLDQNGERLGRLDEAGVMALRRAGAISAGMIPKLEAGLFGVAGGVPEVEIRCPEPGPGTRMVKGGRDVSSVCEL